MHQTLTYRLPPCFMDQQQSGSNRCSHTSICWAARTDTLANPLRPVYTDYIHEGALKLQCSTLLQQLVVRCTP
jgi:hypothetical protein